MSEPASAPEPRAFDADGLPLTLFAALAMTDTQLEEVLIVAMARLKRKTPAVYRAAATISSDGTPHLTSLETVWLLAEFSTHFPENTVNLARVPDRARWSSINGVAGIIRETQQ